MWILPKPIILAFAPGTEESTWLSSRWCQMGAPLLMWRSKPSPSRTWLQRWKRENWIKHLCGRTLRLSQRRTFTDWWTSSLEATRANRSVPPVNDSEPKTQDIFGHTFDEQFDLFAQAESSSKTWKDTYRLDSPQYSAIWTKMVIEQRGEYLVRRNAALHTNANESLSWPTPVARDHKDTGENTDYKKLAKKHKLAGAVQSWPTPTTAEAQKIPNVANYGQKGLSNHPEIRGLPDREKLRKSGKNPEQWPTPKAGDPGSRKPGTGGKVLAEEAKKNWATPEAQNQVGCQTRHGKTFPRLGTQTGGKLNPNWVEQLMGVPVGWTQLPVEWTDFDSSETALFRQPQQKHGQS
jgi:hypothetical protein